MRMWHEFHCISSYKNFLQGEEKKIVNVAHLENFLLGKKKKVNVATLSYSEYVEILWQHLNILECKNWNMHCFMLLENLLFRGSTSNISCNIQIN